MSPISQQRWVQVRCRIFVVLKGAVLVMDAISVFNIRHTGLKGVGMVMPTGTLAYNMHASMYLAMHSPTSSSVSEMKEMNLQRLL